MSKFPSLKIFALRWVTRKQRNDVSLSRILMEVSDEVPNGIKESIAYWPEGW